MDGYLAHAADGDQGHGIRGGVRVGRGEGEPRGGGVRDEERGDGEAELIDEVRREEVAQDSGAAFGEESQHHPFGIKVCQDGGQRRLRARVLRDLLAADLVDELRLAIAPVFVGDPAAPRFALPAPYPHTAGRPMTLVSVRRVGEVAVHHYRLTDRRPPEAVPPG